MSPPFGADTRAPRRGVSDLSYGHRATRSPTLETTRTFERDVETPPSRKSSTRGPLGTTSLSWSSCHLTMFSIAAIETKSSGHASRVGGVATLQYSYCVPVVCAITLPSSCQAAPSARPTSPPRSGGGSTACPSPQSALRRCLRASSAVRSVAASHGTIPAWGRYSASATRLSHGPATRRTPRAFGARRLVGRAGIKAGTVLYKVLWEGWPEELATWEEEEDIPCGEEDFVSHSMMLRRRPWRLERPRGPGPIAGPTRSCERRVHSADS